MKGHVETENYGGFANKLIEHSGETGALEQMFPVLHAQLTGALEIGAEKEELEAAYADLLKDFKKRGHELGVLESALARKEEDLDDANEALKEAKEDLEKERQECKQLIEELATTRDVLQSTKRNYERLWENAKANPPTPQKKVPPLSQPRQKQKFCTFPVLLNDQLGHNGERSFCW